MPNREAVYDLINGERAYQERRWPQNPSLPPSDELRLIRVLLDQADAAWYTTQDRIQNGVKVNPADLDALRKIAGVAVRALENYGAPARES